MSLARQYEYELSVNDQLKIAKIASEYCPFIRWLYIFFWIAIVVVLVFFLMSGLLTSGMFIFMSALFLLITFICKRFHWLIVTRSGKYGFLADVLVIIHVEDKIIRCTECYPEGHRGEYEYLLKNLNRLIKLPEGGGYLIFKSNAIYLPKQALIDNASIFDLVKF